MDSKNLLVKMESDILTYEQFPDYFKEHKIVPRYEPFTELRIPHDWWGLDHDKIERGLKAMSKSTTGVMLGMADDDVEIRHLFKVGDVLYKIQRSKTFVVALSGPQAAGKSSFLNSLLDCPGLCLAAADGRACTNAIVRYVYYRGTTESAAMAEIKFHDQKRIAEIVEQHAKDYYHFFHFDDEAAEADDEEDVPKKRRTHDEADVKAKETAQEIFETLFGGIEQFQEAWSPDGYTSGAFQDECVRKCAEAVGKLDLNKDGVAIRAAPTPSELSKMIKPFTTKVSSAVSLWPLVDTIRYGLNRELLGQGFEFVDLPGWGDRNTAKTRHADEVRDTVDIEMILVDKARIETEDVAINKMRSALQSRGVENVIIVATKTDALSDSDLDHCEGERFDQINQLLQFVEAKVLQAEEDGDEEEQRHLENYATYLNRERIRLKVLQSSASISQTFETKFEDLVQKERVRLFHSSASMYLKWIEKARLPFAKQPALAPNMTGIPEIRRFLFNLTASSNLRDTRNQVFNEVDSYLDMIDRVVNAKDRSAGFTILANDFAGLHEGCIVHIKLGTADLFNQCSNILENTHAFANAVEKQCIDRMVSENWSSYPHGSFNRILKEKGNIPAGLSKAKCLANGCDWNRELSVHLEETLREWRCHQHWMNETLQTSLCNFFQDFFGKVIRYMTHSKSEVSAIDTAKRKWTPYKRRMLAQVGKLIKGLTKTQASLYRQATMSDGSPTSLVPELTNKLWDEIYKSLPAEKKDGTGKRKQYVEPKHKFQKRVMLRLFCDPKNHFFDRALNQFQIGTDNALGRLRSEFISDIDEILEDFKQLLRDLVPITYYVTPQGENIRSALRDLLPSLRGQAIDIQDLVPSEPVKINDDEQDDIDDSEFNGRGLSSYIDKKAAANPAPPRATSRKLISKKDVKIKKESEEECFFTIENTTANKRRRID